MLVVMGGSYNSLMSGNAAETVFYRLELGKDIRTLFFYCKNISLPICLAKQSLFCKQSNWFYLFKKRKYNQKSCVFTQRCAVFIYSFELQFIIVVR